MSRLNTYWRRKADRVCVDCGGDSDGHLRCIKCIRERAEQQADRLGCKRQNCCSRCGQPGHNIRSCMEQIRRTL